MIADDRLLIRIGPGRGTAGVCRQHALWNQPLLILRHGGSTILGTGRVLWFGEVPRGDRRRLAGLLGSLPGSIGGAEEKLLLELRFHGLVRLAGAAPASIRDESIAVEGWAFHSPWLEKISSTIEELAAAPGGISAPELGGKIHIDADALKRLLWLLVERDVLLLSGSLYFAKARRENQALSPAARKLIALIESGGSAGFESTRTTAEGAQKDLKTLIRLGMVVPLEGGICYTWRTYDSLAATILEGRAVGERFSIPEAKERTGLSRKYMIPLLNRMEKDGMLRRDGDVRITLVAARSGSPGASTLSR